MLCIGSIGDFVVEALLAIFLGLIDTVVYMILALLYSIWELLAKLDIFGGGGPGEQIYDLFTSRIYTFISIVMVFIFAYKLICYILDPEDKNASVKGIMKKLVTSVVMVVLAPLVFKYLSVFQYHIVANNTIPSIVLGTNGGNEKIPAGKQLSMITLMSFYHPNEANYNTFVKNPNGTECTDIIEERRDKGDAVLEWGRKMTEWCEDDDMTPGELTTDGDLRSQVVEGNITYLWIVCTGGGIAVCYFLIQYCISIGTRAARLGFLEIIAPIPIMLRMFTDSMFKTWFDEMKKTYLELFVRIAIISFVVFLCTLIPGIIAMIFNA